MNVMIKKNTRKPKETSVEQAFSVMLQRLRRDRGLCQREGVYKKGKSKK
jgi:hypothetical protein